MAEVDRVLIAGGGIAGLSLAAELARRGIAAEVVERASQWPAVGAGITLHANCVRALDELGVADAIRQRSARLERWRFCDARGAPLCDTDLADLWGAVGPCLGITRAALHEVLLGAAGAGPRRLGVAVTAIEQSGDRVTVGFSDGTAGDYGLVVGADGVGSTVRGHAVEPTVPHYAGTMAWRSVVAVRPTELHDLTLLMGDGRFFGLVPVGGGGTYGFAGIESEPVDDPVVGRAARLRDAFAGFGGPVPEYLAALADDHAVHVGPVQWLELDRWHAGRVVLIGDAAHATPPHMGQGGALAIEDALVLAHELGAADTVEAALARYEARRRPRADWVREQSRVAAAAWLLPPAVRDEVLRERGDELLRARYAPLVAAP